jgi:tetratricopeptide (TPR) repeat protein
MTAFLIGELQKAVRSSDRKPLIVCGAGISTQATNGKAPSWANLIQSGIQRVEDLDANAGPWANESRQKLATGGTDIWIAIADEVTERLGGSHNAEFATWLEGEVGRLAPERYDLLDAIKALGCPIATTNYDDVLTKATGLPPISWSDHAATLRLLRAPTPEGILHLHGHWRTPEEVVLGSKSYGAHSADSRRNLLQQIATLARATVFIGCSQNGLADPDFSRLDSFLSEWQDIAPRRYWLIRQETDGHGNPQPPLSPLHAKRLFPVIFGKAHGDLLPLLRSLPPPTPALTIDPDAAIRCIDQHEPKPELFGRDREVELVVGALLAGKPAIVAGGPGMGKTAVATAALYDPRMVATFRRRRVFASLETATEPRAILAKLVEALGLPPTGDEVSLLRILEANAAERPIAAILDNADTSFDLDRGESERLLNLAAQIEHLSLAVTIRGVAPHVAGAIPIDDLPKLPPLASKDAFIAIAGASFRTDPDLPYLLEALDGHALSIHLVAAQASGLPTLKGLRGLWDEVHAEILRRPGEKESRLTSVRVSLALSLSSRRMKSAPLARRLLAMLALLPAGLAEANVHSLLGERGTVTRGRAAEVVACLYQLRLVERRRDSRLRMLTPLRECARHDIHVMPNDRKRLVDRYMIVAEKGGKIGRSDWSTVRNDVEAESDNLDPICEVVVETDILHRRLDVALNGLAAFHQLSGRATVNSVTRAVERLREQSPQRAANYMCRLGSIAFMRSDHDTARAWLDGALALFRRVGDLIGEAECIQLLGMGALQQSDHVTALARFEEALALRRSAHSTLGEANCIFNLGEIARRRSDHVTATDLFESASTLFQSAGSVVSKAHCICSLGHIALERSDYATALDRFETALALYRHGGLSQGEANCILGLGAVARLQSDDRTATALFEQALTLFRHLGEVMGEANCTRGIGEIALTHKDYPTAAARFEEAQALYRKSRNQHSLAQTMIRLGLVRLYVGDTSQGLANIEAGFALYFNATDTQDRALLGWRALHRALVCKDTAEAARHREEARASWTAVGRLDLITDWLAPTMTK